MVPGSDFDATLFSHDRDYRDRRRQLGQLVGIGEPTGRTTPTRWWSRLTPRSPAGAVGSYQTYFAAFSFYFVKAHDTNSGSHGTITITGLAKTA